MLLGVTSSPDSASSTEVVPLGLRPPDYILSWAAPCLCCTQWVEHRWVAWRFARITSRSLKVLFHVASPNSSHTRVLASSTDRVALCLPCWYPAAGSEVPLTKPDSTPSSAWWRSSLHLQGPLFGLSPWQQAPTGSSSLQHPQQWRWNICFREQLEISWTRVCPASSHATRSNSPPVIRWQLSSSLCPTVQN